MQSSLNSMRRLICLLIGNQCRSFKTGVMCSNVPTPDVPYHRQSLDTTQIIVVLDLHPPQQYPDHLKNTMHAPPMLEHGGHFHDSSHHFNNVAVALISLLVWIVLFTLGLWFPEVLFKKNRMVYIRERNCAHEQFRGAKTKILFQLP